MKQKIEREIARFIKTYQARKEIATEWGTPEVGYADAHSPYVRSLRQIISPSHGLPEEVLPDATVVLVYYIPFAKALAKSNAPGRLASPAWARAYEETNAMFQKLNAHLIAFLDRLGYQAVVPKATATFDQKKLISDWSHRHFAYAAGMGTFGVNNMLLTRQGCCGRFFSLVTNLPAEPGQPMEEELCPYKKDGSCGVCIKNCPVQALSGEGYDRQKCYALVTENAKVHTGYGSSYMDETGETANSAGSEVCGKCVTASPCMLWKRSV